MTYKEIVDIYKTAFIVSLREAARETGNNIYLKVDQAIEEGNNYILKAIQDEIDFKLMVCIFCSAFFIKIYGIEEVSKWDLKKSNEMINGLYNSFLVTTTKKFCRKYGLETFDDLGYYFSVKSIV